MNTVNTSDISIKVLVCPFWRYAVVATKGRAALMAGIPFYKESEARSFYQEICRDVPETASYIVRRSWFGRLSIVDGPSSGEKGT